MGPGSNPRLVIGVSQVRTQGWALFWSKFFFLRGRPTEVGGGMFPQVLLHPRARSDRFSNFSLFWPPDPQDPPGHPHKPCISLISLWTRVKSLICGFEPGGVWDRTQGWALFSTKKIEPGRSTHRVREWVGGMFLRVLLHPRARSDRTSNFSRFSPPDPLRTPRPPLEAL
jgi:hypothetical protein